MKPMFNALRDFARNRGGLVRNLVRFSLLPTTLALAVAWTLETGPVLIATAIRLYAVNLFLAALLYFSPPRRRNIPDPPKQ